MDDRADDKISRRAVLWSLAATGAGGKLRRWGRGLEPGEEAAFLSEVGYGDVEVTSSLERTQMENARTVLLGLSDDSLLMPFRKMAGREAPGTDLGGWYQYLPDYDYKHGDAGLAPGLTFGQWVSALSRMYAATGAAELRERVERLNGMLGEEISPAYFAKNRFPAYCFDKLVCGLMDAARLVGDAGAMATLAKVTQAALPELPGRAVDREVNWRGVRGAFYEDISWTWDESYTLPENLYLVSSQTRNRDDAMRYRKMAEQYLDDATYFDPLARGEDVLGGKQAYSYVNALCSAMQAYMVGGSAKHLAAARNGFEMLERQSFATGGWGPDEQLRGADSEAVYGSVTSSHNSFEAPCGSYAHMKLTRYLLRCTRDGRYGDSMERVLYNAARGILPLQTDGRAFYSADYSLHGQRIYSVHRWPCCSGTYPQLAADYGINSFYRSPGVVWVNLYLSSTLRVHEADGEMELRVGGDYPQGDTVTLLVTCSKSMNFEMRLRVPGWAQGAQLRVNGREVEPGIRTGFAVLRRRWRTGDRVELRIPMTIRMEGVTPQDAARHPERVAILRGPRMLFAVSETPVSASRTQILAARQVSLDEWEMASDTGPVRLVPFSGVGDASYTSFVKVMERAGTVK